MTRGDARHIKAVPGRKTDVRDCEWLADLLRHGLLKTSFIPPREIREIRELTRYRQTLVTEHTAVANRLQKLLESVRNDAGRRGTRPLRLFPTPHIECGVYSSERPIRLPARKIIKDRAAGREIYGQGAPLAETLQGTVALGIPIHVGGACSRARGVLETDLTGKNATFANPAILIQLIEWAEKLLTE